LEKNSNEINEVFKLSVRDLSIVGDTLTPVDSEQALKTWLQTEILRMLRNDFHGLVNALYRIDVSETKVKEVFNGQDEKLIAEQLAQMIIEREKEKIAIRKKYSG
jgi:hypothetical protein